MTDKSSEILRYNLYIIVGLLAGLSIGIGVGPQFRDFVINNGWPNESISWATMSLIFVSIMLNGFLLASRRSTIENRSRIHQYNPKVDE